MISVSDEWRENFYENRTHLQIRAILTIASGTVYYLDYEDDDDDFIELALADATSSESSFDVGNFVLNTCTFKLNNSDRKWKNILLENAKLEPYVGFQHPRLNYALASGNYNTDSDTSAWTASATAFSSYYTITAYDGYMRLYCKTATSAAYYTYLTLTDDFDSSIEYYTITFKVRASASKAINVYAKRENNNGNSSYVQVGAISASEVTANTWTEHSITFSPDEDYTYTGIGFSMGTFNTSGNYLDVEYLIIEQGEEFTEYNRAREDFTENGVEWVKKGTFYISDTGKRGSRISLTAYDNTNAFETSFSGVSITYPITLANFVKKICDYVGVPLATTTFPNSTYSISTAPNTSSTDYTCRQMISYAAMLAGCYARCNVDGELELKWYDSATNIHTIPAYSSFDNNESDTEITGVKVVAMASENVDSSADEDSSESTSDEYTYGSDDDYLITIQENPLVPYGNAEAVAKLIGAQIVGTTFRSSEISALYDPSMEAGDTVQTENEDGDTVTFYAANISVSLGSYASIRCSSSEDNSSSGSTSVLSYIMGQTADLVNAKFENFITKNLSAEIANIGYLTADEISATYIATDELQAKVAEFGYVSADTLDTSVANILKLTTSELYAAVADLGYLTADSIIADDVTAKTLVADVASITSLLSGNIGTGTLQAIHITGDNVIFDEAVITDAAIVSLTADKITSGTIYTDLVTIQSNADDTSLWINGSVIQMSDGPTVRVQLGKDASGTYNFYIWDADGNLMWDALGVTAEGLNDGIIVDANIADDANINESKIDMQSVAERLNEDGSITVDYANIIVNDTTLDYALASVTTAANNAQSAADAVATTLETELEVVQGQISAIVSETGIENLEDGTSIYDLYSKINATVGDITSEVSSTQTQLDNLSVGSRNYLPNTRTMDGWTKSSNVTPAEDDEGYTVATWAAVSKLDWNSIKSRDPIQLSLIRGQTVTISLDARSDEYESLNADTTHGLLVVLALCTADSTTRTLYRSKSFYTTELSDEWQRLSYTITASDDYFSNGSGTIDDTTRVCVEVYDYSLYRLQVRKLKLELGSVATDWTPAPEDTESVVTTLTDEYSTLSLTVGDITSEVSGIKTFIGDAYSTTQTLSAVINQQVTDSAANILLEVSNNYITTAYAETTYATSASLALTVKDGVGVLSANADHIYFSGRDLVIDMDNLTLDEDGNVAISGEITAESGTIGGFSITGTCIYRTYSTYGTSGGIYFGTSGLSLGSTFKVSNDGALACTSGTIGGWTIGDYALYNGTSDLYDETDGIYLGTDGIASVNDGDILTIAYGLAEFKSLYDSRTVSISSGSVSLHSVGSSDEFAGSSILFTYNGSTRFNVYADSTGLIADNGKITSYYTNIAYGQERDDTGFGVSFGVGSGGYNRGVYDITNATWMLYKSEGDVVTLQNPQSVINIITEGRLLVRPYTALTTDNTGCLFAVQRTASSAMATTTTDSVIFCAGVDSTSPFIRSYPAYARTTTGSANVHITSSGTFATYQSSASRFKNTINYFDNVEYASDAGLAKRDYTVEESDYRDDYRVILKFPVVQFHYNTGYMTGEPDYDYTKYVTGFIAEDIAALCPACATYTEDGQIEAWNHMEMIPRMVACIQDIYTDVTLIDDRVTILEAQLAEAQLEIATLKKQLQASAA